MAVGTIRIEIYRTDRLRETWSFYLNNDFISLAYWFVEEKPKYAKAWKTIKSWDKHYHDSRQTTQDEKPELTQEIIDLVHKKLCEIPIK